MSSKKNFLDLKPRIWQELYALFKARNPQESKEDTSATISSLLVDKFNFAKEIADTVAPTLFDLMNQSFTYLRDEASREAAINYQTKNAATSEDAYTVALLDLNDPTHVVINDKIIDAENTSPSLYFEESHGERLLFSAQDLLILSAFIKNLFNQDDNLPGACDSYIECVKKMEKLTASEDIDKEAYATTRRNLEHYKRYLKRNNSFQLMSLLTSFVAYARFNSHPSNWIHYKKGVIFHMADLSKIKEFEQVNLTQQLYSDYKLNMQVIGSTNPIPCYQFEWMANQPTPGNKFTENPFIDVGGFEQKYIMRIVLFLYKVNIKDYIDPILAKLK